MDERTIDNAKQIAALWESAKSAHKRIDENDKVVDEIHELAKSVNALAVQVKYLAEKVDSTVTKLENSLKTQGERIGRLEKEPGDKWKTVTGQVVGIVIAAVGGFFMSKFFG